MTLKDDRQRVDVETFHNTSGFVVEAAGQVTVDTARVDQRVGLVRMTNPCSQWLFHQLHLALVLFLVGFLLFGFVTLFWIKYHLDD